MTTSASLGTTWFGCRRHSDTRRASTMGCGSPFTMDFDSSCKTGGTARRRPLWSGRKSARTPWLQPLFSKTWWRRPTVVACPSGPSGSSGAGAPRCHRPWSMRPGTRCSGPAPLRIHRSAGGDVEPTDLEPRASATHRRGALDHVDVEVRDEGGDPVAPGQPGELAVRGPNTCVGYFDDPERTASTFVGGWAVTGDLVAEDEDGYVTVVGRKKEIIIRGGINITPRDRGDAHPLPRGRAGGRRRPARRAAG